MQHVVTAKQARAITGGRLPHVPVEFETAVKALAECISLDESRYWSDKADALAAWAKIYRSDEVALKAKALKLHAYRRMGELARELRPRPGRPLAKGESYKPGQRALLAEHGLSLPQARAAIHLATIPKKTFEQLLVKPVAPTTAHLISQGRPLLWGQFYHSVSTLRAFIRRTYPETVVAEIRDQPKFVEHARALHYEVSEWLDEFEQRLPKAKGHKPMKPVQL